MVQVRQDANRPHRRQPTVDHLIQAHLLTAAAALNADLVQHQQIDLAEFIEQGGFGLATVVALANPEHQIRNGDDQNRMASNQQMIANRRGKMVFASARAAAEHKACEATPKVLRVTFRYGVRLALLLAG